MSTNLCIFDYLLLLFVKFHVWNISTTAWNPVGGKAACSHTSGECRNSCCREKFTSRKHRGSLTPHALRERGAAGQGSLLYSFAVRNISMATKALLGGFVLLLLGVLLGISLVLSSQPSSAAYHLERALWSCCWVNPWASAKYHQRKYKVREVLDLSPGGGTLCTKLRQSLSNQRAVGMCCLQRSVMDHGREHLPLRLLYQGLSQWTLVSATTRKEAHCFFPVSTGCFWPFTPYQGSVHVNRQVLPIKGTQSSYVMSTKCRSRGQSLVVISLRRDLTPSPSSVQSQSSLPTTPYV